MSNITMEQIIELIAQSETGRVTRENLQAFLMNPKGYTSRNPTEYSVTIDHSLTVEEMVTAGKYDWSDDQINGENFSIKGNGRVETMVVKILQFDRPVGTDEANKELERKRLRGATLEELLAFGATFPDVQREFPVIALGSSWVDPDGHLGRPCLMLHGAARRLVLEWGYYRWGCHFRFLAVRK